MAEYIERAAAITVCDKQYRECLRKSDFCGDTVAWNICADIKAIPAADVAPVVRCKDCARYRMGACEKVYTDGNVFSAAWQERKPDDFCSYGEPKEG